METYARLADDVEPVLNTDDADIKLDELKEETVAELKEETVTLENKSNENDILINDLLNNAPNSNNNNNNHFISNNSTLSSRCFIFCATRSGTWGWVLFLISVLTFTILNITFGAKIYDKQRIQATICGTLFYCGIFPHFIGFFLRARCNPFYQTQIRSTISRIIPHKMYLRREVENTIIRTYLKWYRYRYLLQFFAMSNNNTHEKYPISYTWTQDVAYQLRNEYIDTPFPLYYKSTISYLVDESSNKIYFSLPKIVPKNINCSSTLIFFCSIPFYFTCHLMIFACKPSKTWEGGFFNSTLIVLALMFWLCSMSFSYLFQSIFGDLNVSIKIPDIKIMDIANSDLYLNIILPCASIPEDVITRVILPYLSPLDVCGWEKSLCELSEVPCLKAERIKNAQKRSS